MAPPTNKAFHLIPSLSSIVVTAIGSSLFTTLMEPMARRYAMPCRATTAYLSTQIGRPGL